MSRVLIDTQALIWFAQDASALSPRAVTVVDDPATVRLASVASIWEMAIKLSIGKLTLVSGTLDDFVGRFKGERYTDSSDPCARRAVGYPTAGLEHIRTPSIA